MSYPSIKPASSFHGTLTDDIRSLFLYGGEWFVPSPHFRRLIAEFGESIVRTLICNSSRPINPATVDETVAAVISKACLQVKEAAKKNPAAETAVH